MQFFPPRSILAASFPLFAAACLSANVIQDPSASGGGGGDASIIKLDGSALRLPDAPNWTQYRGSDAPPGPNCGNRERGPDEACDDGNNESGDGCANNCLSVEPGFSCAHPGEPCRPIARCGDGLVVFPEQCDDGDTEGGDGCSGGCKIEIGFKCDGSPSHCTHTTCGDKKIEGAEGCDDGNAMPFDGCSADCQNEPTCEGTAACTSRCGDGIVLNEECDDGNSIDGDGCSSDCKKETGFECGQPELGDKMLVPAVYRDFRYRNPTDFEGGVTGQTAESKGMVQAELDRDGKPVFTGITGGAIHVESKDTFAKWYRNVDGVNHATASKLALWNNGKGAYVNRYGANGEQWNTTEIAYYCGNVGQEMLDDEGNPIPCTSMYQATSSTNCTERLDKGMEMLKCWTENGSYKATFIVTKEDGNPTFFPVDEDNFTPASERTAAQIPPLYDATASWPFDTDDSGAKRQHNFSFTSEVRYWFKFEEGKTYQLDFVGDDDVWVFINKKLAVDLGGIHTPVAGSVTLNASTAAKYGLKAGSVYEAAVFQAERQTTGSSYKLTLSGFNAAPSDCRPVCGDGVLAIGEECDDGDKNGRGGYGACSATCTLGTFCGDGIRQEENGEDCDDGGKNGQEGYCPLGCRKIVIF